MSEQREFVRSIPSPLGILTLHEKNGGLIAVDFADACASEDTALLREAEAQLCAYFAGRLRRFHLPLHPQGTAFQLRVWAGLQTIPYGETRSYGALAAQLAVPRAVRALGGANGKNPLPILIPCHRVIAGDGRLGGYSGGLAIKRALLDLEGAPYRI